MVGARNKFGFNGFVIANGEGVAPGGSEVVLR
jgi:hypothetical protein